MRKWTTRNRVIKSCLARITLLLLSTLSIIKGIGSLIRRRLNTAPTRASAPAFSSPARTCARPCRGHVGVV